MRITNRRVPTLALSLALVMTTTGFASATQDGETTDEHKQTRQIVRVISASDGSGVETNDRNRVVIVGEDDGSVPRILAGFSHSRSYLGVRLVDLTPELRRHFGVPEDAGLMVSTVLEDSPASRAGLRVGDIITAIDAESLDSGFELARKISKYEDQSVVTLEVWRDGRGRTLSVTIAERERPAIDIGRIGLPHSGQIHERVWIGSEGLPEHILEIDQGGLRDALRELELRFDNPAFKDKLRVLGQDRQDLQLRIQELEDRLKNLEHQLDRLPCE